MDDQAKSELRRKAEKIVAWDSHPDDDGLVDAQDIAQAYLAEHPVDDDEMVTRDWLLSVGFLRDGEDSSKAFAKKIWDKFQSEDYGEEPAMQVLIETKDSSVWLETYSKDGDTLALIELRIGKTRGDVRRLCRALGIELKGTNRENSRRRSPVVSGVGNRIERDDMTKHTIEIELPDHIEPDGEPKITVMCSSPTNAVHFVMPVRPVWQWPEWLTSEWIAMDKNGSWFAYHSEPTTNDHYWSDGSFQAWLGNQITELWPTSFRPPPCANWRQSKRRNPRSKQP